MSKFYLGLTIGPIVRTLQSVRRTNDLWAASYLFSYIMKQIVKALRQEHTFLIPYVKDESLFKEDLGVGLFPDRFILSSDESQLVAVKQLADKTLAKFLNDVDPSVLAWAKDYFKLYVVEIKETSEKAAVLTLGQLLDVAEMQPTFPHGSDDAALARFISKTIEKGEKGILLKDAFGDDPNKIPMITEIATRGLIGTSTHKESLYKSIIYKEGEKDSDIMKLLKQTFNDHFKTYHKYMAIIFADGDRIGETIQSLKEGEFDKFSKCLFDFGQEAKKIINDYQGTPVYIGGDDLLMFAPVVNGKNEHILDLVQELNTAFKKAFIGFEVKPTLSFGVSIAYYKYPLRESLKTAIDLIYEGKNRFDIEDKKSPYHKNALCLRVMKHSGSFYDVRVPLGSDFSTLMSEILKGMSDNPKKFLNSVTYNLRSSAKLFEVIGNDRTRLANYFANNYDEKVHQGSDKEILFNNAAGLLINGMTIEAEISKNRVKEFQSDDKTRNNDAIRNVYSSLRLFKFLKGIE